ncbi:efflux RND transporter permease subunit, partial [Fervidibacter sacchari]
MNQQRLGLSGRIAAYFSESKLTPLFVLASIMLGVFAVATLPREEEPQIKVPMIDIFVQAPGMSPKEVEERVTTPMEKLLWEIPGVEYIYSTSSEGMAMAVVRYFVGTDEETAVIRTYSKLYMHLDKIPPGVSMPLVKPRSIDDVPILALTFWGEGYDHYRLRRIASEVEREIKTIDNVSETTIIGGLRRQIKVLLDPQKLSAYHIDPMVVIKALTQSNNEMLAGHFAQSNYEFRLKVGKFIEDAEDAKRIVVGVFNGRPVYLGDIASVSDGPEEPSDYVFFAAGKGWWKREHRGDSQFELVSHFTPRPGELYPAVTITVAKRKGANAIVVANQVLEKVELLKGRIIPKDVNVTVTRNYGETAREKNNELLFHMALAVISVTLLIAFALGIRESGVVLIAIP